MLVTAQPWRLAESYNRLELSIINHRQVVQKGYGNSLHIQLLTLYDPKQNPEVIPRQVVIKSWKLVLSVSFVVPYINLSYFGWIIYCLKSALIVKTTCVVLGRTFAAETSECLQDALCCRRWSLKGAELPPQGSPDGAFLQILWLYAAICDQTTSNTRALWARAYLPYTWAEGKALRQLSSM